MFFLIIQKSLSDWQRVYLSRVSLASTGHYRCEVSAEGPSFSSVSGSGHMEVNLDNSASHVTCQLLWHYVNEIFCKIFTKVVVLPKKTPEITGGKRTDRAGDLVDVNCTSAASKPAAEIKWFINGIEVYIHFASSH